MVTRDGYLLLRVRNQSTCTLQLLAGSQHSARRGMVSSRNLFSVNEAALSSATSQQTWLHSSHGPSEQRRAFHNHNNTLADTRLLVSSRLTSSTSHLTQRVGKFNIAIASCCSQSLFLLKFLVTRLQAVIDCSLSVYYIYLGAAGGCFCAVVAKLLASCDGTGHTAASFPLLSPVPSSPLPGQARGYNTHTIITHNMPTAHTRVYTFSCSCKNMAPSISEAGAGVCNNITQQVLNAKLSLIN